MKSIIIYICAEYLCVYKCGQGIIYFKWGSVVTIVTSYNKTEKSSKSQHLRSSVSDLIFWPVAWGKPSHTSPRLNDEEATGWRPSPSPLVRSENEQWQKLGVCSRRRCLPPLLTSCHRPELEDYKLELFQPAGRQQHNTGLSSHWTGRRRQVWEQHLVPFSFGLWVYMNLSWRTSAEVQLRTIAQFYRTLNLTEWEFIQEFVMSNYLSCMKKWPQKLKIRLELTFRNLFYAYNGTK